LSEVRLTSPATLDRETGAALMSDLHGQGLAKGATVVLDLSGADRIDSEGCAWLLRIAEHARGRGGAFRWEGQRGHVAEFIDLIEPSLEAEAEKKPRPEGILERVGATAIAVWDEGRQMTELLADAVYWMLLAPFEGRGFRVENLLDEMYEMGFRAVPINIVLNFLLGLTIAMMSAAQLSTLGLDIWVAGMVVISFTRELAPIMTAVVVSARTGAAITAEMANMKVQEEIDALRGMGINVPQYLVAPKLLALVLVMPCLTMIGMYAGVAGGAFWGTVVLGFNLNVWLEQSINFTKYGDIAQGLTKSFFFANAIVLIGCHNGMRVRGGSRGVGLMTTRSVVMDIFTIVVIDMVFALVFYYVLD
jgi:phospholipid/cholesterol/gamma-HCH transport system permease protein